LPLQIFLSHTDSQDAAAIRWRKRLSRGLQRQGFQVLLDEERLPLGDAWRRQLYVWILGCDAGVILVSEKALDGTDWMRLEASMLVMLRTASLVAQEQGLPQPTFPVIPVLVDSVTPEQFEKSWLKTYELDEFQAAAATGELVKQIATRLEPLKAREAKTPLLSLQGVIGPWLNRVDLRTLRAAGRALQAPVDTWRDDEVSDRLAYELLKADLGGVYGAMEVLAPQLQGNDASRLVEILAAGWVDPEAAARLPPVSRRDGRRVVAINGSRPRFTASAYVQRAWARFPPPKIAFVTEAGERDADGMAREILDAVQRARPAETTDEDALAAIDRAARNTAFLVAIKDLPAKATIDALTTRFPSATFVFLSGPDVLASEARVEYLRPELDPDCEQNAFDLYGDTCALIEDALGGR
jgi:hypothetical protein